MWCLLFLKNAHGSCHMVLLILAGNWSQGLILLQRTLESSLYSKLLCCSSKTQGFLWMKKVSWGTTNTSCLITLFNIVLQIFLKLILEREEGRGREVGWGGRERKRQRERERERERERNIDLLFHLFMHSLVASCMCPEVEPATLVYLDDALTN